MGFTGRSWPLWRKVINIHLYAKCRTQESCDRNMVHVNVCMQTGPAGTNAGASLKVTSGNKRSCWCKGTPVKSSGCEDKKIFFQLFSLAFELIQSFLLIFWGPRGHQWSIQLCFRLIRLDVVILDPWTEAPVLLNQVASVNTVAALYNPNVAGLNSSAPLSYLTVGPRLLWPVYSLFCLVVSALNRNNNRRLNRSQIQPASLEGLRPFILRYILSRNKNRCFTYREKKGN